MKIVKKHFDGYTFSAALEGAGFYELLIRRDDPQGEWRPMRIDITAKITLAEASEFSTEVAALLVYAEKAPHSQSMGALLDEMFAEKEGK